MAIKLFWPTEYPTLTQAFGANPDYYGKYGLPGHEGLDFKAPHGSEIYACADGVVKLVADSGNYGKQIRILHEGGAHETIYAHLEEPLVVEGQMVWQGQLIGHADNTGNSRGDHLHLTWKVYGDYGKYAAKGYGGSIADPTPFLMPFGEKPMRNLACGNVIQVGYSDDEIVAVVLKLQPEYMVVTSRPALARRLIAETGTKVIYRRWPDDGPSFNGDPVAFVNLLHAEAPKGALLSLPNEPGTITPKFAADTLTALQTATAVGRVAVFGNFATGNPEPAEWNLLRPAVLYAKANGHILGLHEYWYYNPLDDFPYHVGRFLKVYEIFGSSTPQIVMTEVGFAASYDPHQGWFRNINEAAMAEMLRDIHALYRRYDIPYCVFSFGGWPDGGNKRGDFDVMRSQTIMSTLYSFLGDRLMTTVGLPVNSLVYNGVVKDFPGTNTSQNIRSGPGLTYPLVGTLRLNDVIQYASPVQYAGWYWIKRGTLEGWTAMSVANSPLVIENLSALQPYNPLEDLRKLRANLDAIISKYE